MQRYGMSKFADTFAEKASDTDYSRHPDLQGVTQYDIRAAGDALWQRITRSGGDAEEFSKRITGMDVIETLLAKAERYDDDNHLVSVNYEGYWDWTDKLGLSSGLRQQMQEELTRKYLTEKRAEGFVTVSNQWGIWLFKWEGRPVSTWKGAALLKWYAGGQLAGEEILSFGVECPALPKGDRLTADDARRLTTLQLVCAEAKQKYGAPPRVVTVQIDGDEPQPSGLHRARWRLDSGGFCHGSGIMNVAPPPRGARLMDLQADLFSRT